MSIHVQLSPEALERLRIQRRNSTISSCIVSLLFVVLIGLILGFFLLNPMVKEPPVIVTYQSNVTDETSVEERKVQTSMERKPSSPSASMTKVIVSTNVSDISIPVPEVDVTSPSLDFGDGDEFGTGWGDDAGAGGGGGGGGGFGSSNAASGGLQGYMYDLKQDSKKKRLPYRPNNVEDFVDPIVKLQRARFSDNALSDFFRSPDPLYLTRLAIPSTSASQGPKLFKVDKYIEPSGWFAHYRGMVTVPRSGSYRFSGLGDDYIYVAINKKVCLHASYPTLQGHVSKGWKGSKNPNHRSPFGTHKLQYGDWVNLRAGDAVELEIAIGERPGGEVWFILQVEEKGVKYRKDDDGRPILPLFTTAPLSREEIQEIKDGFKNYEIEFDPDKVPIFSLKR